MEPTDGKRSTERAYLGAYAIGVLKRAIEYFLEVRSNRHFSIAAHESHVICSIAREFANHPRRAAGLGVFGRDLDACDETLELQTSAIRKSGVVLWSDVVRSSLTILVGLNAEGQERSCRVESTRTAAIFNAIVLANIKGRLYLISTLMSILPIDGRTDWKYPLQSCQVREFRDDANIDERTVKRRTMIPPPMSRVSSGV